MKKTIKVICPYCGMSNVIVYENLYNDSQLVVCDSLEGGCDKMFVADIEVSIHSKSRKIEEEDE